MRLFRSQVHSFVQAPIFVYCIPSWGNVGQLAGDLLLATLSKNKKLDLIGNIDTDYVLPMTGREQFQTNSKPFLCTPIEVYHVQDTDIYIILQRAPLVNGKSDSYTQNFMELLINLNCQQLIILCGASMTGLSDEFILSDRFFSCSSSGDQSPNFEILFPHLKSVTQSSLVVHLSVKDADRQSEFHDGEDIAATRSTYDDIDSISMRPTGFRIAKDILRWCARHPSPPVLVMGRVCEEGDNRQDGAALASVLAPDLKLLDESGRAFLTKPMSWIRLFGPPPLPSASNMFY